MKNNKMTNLSDAQIEVLTKCAIATKDHRVTKEQLAKAIGVSDERAVRIVIASLRDLGYRICGISSQRGYWLAKNEEDYQIMRRELMSRIKKEQKQIRAMDRSMPGQIEMGF